MFVLGPEQRRQLKTAGRVGSVGLEFVIAILLGYFGGTWLDGKLGTSPHLTYVGLALGIAAGFKGLYDLVKNTDLDQL